MNSSTSTKSRDSRFPVGSDTIDRRAFLSRSAGGVGLLALSQLLGNQTAAASRELHVDAPRDLTKARSVICLFQHGGPSQVDLTDPKPALTKWDGRPYPAGELEIHTSEARGNVMASPFKFRPQGKSGIELSELLPYTGQIADDITLIRSMTTESNDHEQALRCIHTGRTQAGFPTWGSWVSYALGTECQNLPAYVVLSDPLGHPIDGTRNWSAGWLPAVHQGTPFRVADTTSIVHLKTPENVPANARMEQLRFLTALNRRHQLQRPDNNELTARIENFELVARMQTAVPEIFDISRETAATQKLYGLERPESSDYGKRCLLARRLVESGVRFVQVFVNGQLWDTHSNNAATLAQLCKRTEQPAAALVADLKQRGLLESTIVIWAGEFGRLPIAQGTDGRDHNRHGFSIWLAGGGFRGGYVHGETDEFGYRATRDEVTIHDLHATLLHALGLDHRSLTYPRGGRPTSLTDVEITKAKVINKLFA
jgi:hypothetical protein